MALKIFLCHSGMKTKCTKTFGKNGTLVKCSCLAPETVYLLLSSSRKPIVELRNNPVRTSSKSVFVFKIVLVLA